ncbi:DUF393 domain-containing protein [Persicimonas caeni]|uniref:DUF393 domain-containing protein n=1 Tax=Persicimonas caeni TaxID=2292766 RepID=A0A4Y6PVN6_PERCE|nr:DCC1-like thiol-disulfide oxidoreductase family protein [Persicimonas caeni]QDG52303.1 DUF393 domain-containing protein [Persicimonas caeni]QED33525.1 DUF393 domain-containing protein [Persicimonas caeni]
MSTKTQRNKPDNFGRDLMRLRAPHGWTGGQYSVYRAILGVYLCVHFVHLIPWGAEMFSNEGVLADAATSPLAFVFPNVLSFFDPPWFVTGLLVAAAVGSLAFAAGFKDRLVAVGLWYVWACLFGRNPLISNPSLAFVGWMLLLHAATPGKPFGAWDARGRTDPQGGWKLPRSYFSAAWILMAVGYTYSGYTKLISPSWQDGTALAEVLESPLARDTALREFLLGLPDVLLQAATYSTLALELFALPLALVGRLRPWLWLSLVGLHLGILSTVAFADLTVGMLTVHLLTFNPAWIGKLRDGALDHVFYDGSCGLCQRTVRFLLAEDPAEPYAFRFAPLASDAFARRLGEAAPERSVSEMPDSVIVITERGEVLERSEAILYLGKRLGGLWRVLATAASWVPRGVRDRVYDGVAAIRHKLFERPKEACPMMPPEVRGRFDW